MTVNIVSLIAIRILTTFFAQLNQPIISPGEPVILKDKTKAYTSCFSNVLFLYKKMIIREIDDMLKLVPKR